MLSPGKDALGHATHERHHPDCPIRGCHNLYSGTALAEEELVGLPISGLTSGSSSVLSPTKPL
jgi:hypothetical protein